MRSCRHLIRQNFLLKLQAVGGGFRGIAFSNIGTVGREQLITSGSNGEPNWSYIPSKGKSTKTQTEFVSEIKKLAQKAANATDKTEQDSISRQVLQLRVEYLSEVAPDRKQLYQQAKSAMKNQNTNQKCKGTGRNITP